MDIEFPVNPNHIIIEPRKNEQREEHDPQIYELIFKGFVLFSSSEDTCLEVRGLMICVDSWDSLQRGSVTIVCGGEKVKVPARRLSPGFAILEGQLGLYLKGSAHFGGQVVVVDDETFQPDDMGLEE